MELSFVGRVASADRGTDKDKREFLVVTVMIPRSDGKGEDPMVVYPPVDSAVKFGDTVKLSGRAKIKGLWDSKIEVVKTK